MEAADGSRASRAANSMKVISASQGAAALRMSADDFTPPNGFPVGDLSTAIIAAYRCQQVALAPIPQPIPQMPLAVFQNGQFENGGVKFTIAHLGIQPNGIMVIVSSTTENADAVIDDLITLLDRDFGFQIASNPQDRFRVSTLVVRFDRDIWNCSRDLEQICSIVNRVAPQRTTVASPFAFRRLAFGHDGHDAVQTTFENLEWSDFILERRAQTPYSENRFFSSAPLSTAHHVAVLEEIERLFP